MVTIFTPTYNRAYILEKLYESLLIQSSKDFEWLIVDDGSQDSTEDLVMSLIAQNKISINYIKVENGGKHRAINKGVDMAQGESFFIVDSDDRLAENAVERILYHFDFVRDDKGFAGVSGLKVYFNGQRVGGEEDFNVLNCSALDFRFRYKIRGDVAEVFKTDILRKYKFPELEGETFFPEALVWNRIAQKYKIRYFYEKIYLCEYLEDGLSAKITKLRMKNWQASTMYYLELYNMPLSVGAKIKAVINYWRFMFCSGSFIKKNKIYGVMSFFIPFAYLMFINDKRKL